MLKRHTFGRASQRRCLKSNGFWTIPRRKHRTKIEKQMNTTFGVRQFTNLMRGTGNACAWHKRPKLWFTPLVRDMLVASFEKAGALYPTGSIWECLFWSRGWFKQIWSGQVSSRGMIVLFCSDLFNLDVFIYNVIETNLMSGTGNACAWHRSAKLWFACFSNVMLFDSVENVGAFDPTGSNKLAMGFMFVINILYRFLFIQAQSFKSLIIFIFFSSWIPEKDSPLSCHISMLLFRYTVLNTNLINGTGNAWAWHNRPKLWFTCFTNVKLFDSVENVGAFEPTGSNKKLTQFLFFVTTHIFITKHFCFVNFFNWNKEMSVRRNTANPKLLCFAHLSNLRILLFSLELIWILICSFRKLYLINGTGKAWAWQSRAKLCPIVFCTTVPINSLWNDGALAPTGSVSKIKYMDVSWQSVFTHQ